MKLTAKIISVLQESYKKVIMHLYDSFGYSFIVHLNYLHLKALKEQKLEKYFYIRKIIQNYSQHYNHAKIEGNIELQSCFTFQVNFGINSIQK